MQPELDPAQRENIRDDLRGLLRGDVMFDELSRALYSTDASIFQVEPLGVVAPCDEEDLQELVRYSAAQSVPLIPRGAGTGLAGESLGGGLIVDMTRHFRRIVEIGSDHVRVQPGVVLNQLNAELAKAGRKFGPDPASSATCTIGGMLATNASGSRLLRYGYTRDHVAECRVVLDNGNAVTAGVLSLDEPVADGRLQEIVTQTGNLLHQHAEGIRAAQPRTTYNRCGYLLEGVLDNRLLHLPRLLIGAEGTLAMFSEATLKTVPVAGGRAVVLLCFASLESALRAARLSLPLGPSACDLLERRLVSLTRSSGRNAENLIPPDTEAVLMVEFEADWPKEALLAARKYVDQVHLRERLAIRVHSASDAAGIAELWGLREAALPSLYGLGRGVRPVAFVEDVGVPAELLGQFLTRVQDLLQVREMTASYLVHAATGQAHIRPFLDLAAPGDVFRLQSFAEALYGLVLELGGTISTQHGTGIARTPWVNRQYGALYPVMREIKAIWDPTRLLNPDKIICDRSYEPLAQLRQRLVEPKADAESIRVPLLIWNQNEIHTQVEACNGCGTCRVEAAPSRMCPMFRVTHSEKASPRAKANLLRRVLADPDPKRLASADVRAVADLCINCKMCATECPAHVNIPKLMLETKAGYFDEHGLDRADWVLARMDGFARFGSRFALFVNPLLNNRVARWLIEKLFGISRRRRMPSFAWRNFLELAEERGLTRRSLKTAEVAAEAIPFEPGRQPPNGSNRRVAFFVDVFANYNDPSIAESAIAVLQHHGYEVHVPPLQCGSGIAPLSKGDIETAREYAQQNLRVLAELARDGWPIVCTEPSAALMLKCDYLDLMDDPDAQTVAEHTFELTHFLWELHERGELRTDFQPISLGIGHHVPCHIKALGKMPHGPSLLSLIPEMRVHTIDVSCSGMAGTFGMKRQNYRDSLAAGAPMIAELGRPRVMFGSSECSACRMQMEEGSGKKSMHPIQYLALAYGLMPALADRLHHS
jgi:FAD/FMN-containing dehydrogenase/Fe-S oxidoreductase